MQSDEATLITLGSRLAGERLRRNWTQSQLAAEAGISRSTVRRLEAGESTQLTNLIRVLRVLRLLDNLDLLVPEPTTSPIEILERDGKRRRRASSRRTAKPARPWRWGDDA